MRTDRQARRGKLSLLLAALLLVSSALVTAHAFGDANHPAQDECRLLHQFEREHHAPVGIPASVTLSQQTAAPDAATAARPGLRPVRRFLSRAPPVV